MKRQGDEQACCGLRVGNASHLIPVELALKVAAKIDAGEPFGCIIVLPMYSEGLPSSSLPCPAQPGPVLSCPALSCPALTCPALSCPAVLIGCSTMVLVHFEGAFCTCPSLPCLALACLVLPCPLAASLCCLYTLKLYPVLVLPCPVLSCLEAADFCWQSITGPGLALADVLYTKSRLLMCQIL